MGLSTGVIAAIAVVLGLLVAAVALALYRRRKTQLGSKPRSLSAVEQGNGRSTPLGPVRRSVSWKAVEKDAQVKISTTQAPVAPAVDVTTSAPSTNSSEMPNCSTTNLLSSAAVHAGTESNSTPLENRPTSPTVEPKTPEPATPQTPEPQTSKTPEPPTSDSPQPPRSVKSRTNSQKTLRSDVDIPGRSTSHTASKEDEVQVPSLKGMVAAGHWFKRSKADEVAVKVGDAITVYTVYKDAWCFAMNWSSGQSGVMPVAVVSLDEATNLLQRFPPVSEDLLPPGDAVTPPPASKANPPRRSTDSHRAVVVSPQRSERSELNRSSSLLYSSPPIARPAPLPSVASSAMSSHWGAQGVRGTDRKLYKFPSQQFRSTVSLIDNQQSPSQKSPYHMAGNKQYRPDFLRSADSLLPNNRGMPMTRAVASNAPGTPESGISSLAASYFAAISQLEENDADEAAAKQLQATASDLAESVTAISDLQSDSGSKDPGAQRRARQLVTEIKRISQPSVRRDERRKSIVELRSELEKFFDDVFIDAATTAGGPPPPLPEIPAVYRQETALVTPSPAPPEPLALLPRPTSTSPPPAQDLSQANETAPTYPTTEDDDTPLSQLAPSVLPPRTPSPSLTPPPPSSSPRSVSPHQRNPSDESTGSVVVNHAVRQGSSMDTFRRSASSASPVSTESTL
ncbi:uncharacterized protein EV422DRAFT_414462 [Fimicolochytrium jonesii]|uniref:uncharacterized protein n=1 Tax=Fimicolochytrium jonesii TaxID=1396493 RepID=UPI0022FDBCEE|nr:uncharacterized protein EV422DRAFT_414462 [Fimicolochytrium jonesii]KAI8822042.1 hypothetical protein EV422DRAFT_414462 [Fimicolochytrium jonesii]